MNKKDKIIISIFLLLVVIILIVVGRVSVYNLNDQLIREERKQLVEEYYNRKIQKYEQEALEYDNVDIIFLGDSLTDGYNLEEFYPEYITLNRGIGGDTTHRLLKRIEVSTNVKTKVVVMLIGANNFDTMMEDYEDLVSYLDNLDDTKVVLLSLTSMGKEWAKNNQKAIANNKLIQEISREYSATYVDLFNPLLNPETNMIYDEYTTDGGHLTHLGYEVVTKEIKKVLQKLIIE